MLESLSSLRAGLKANARLRVGLWLILVIVWVYLLLLLRDVTQATVGEFQATAKKSARVEAQAKQKEWIARAEPMRTMQIELEDRLWRASTVGLAQATFQDWLIQAVQQAIGTPKGRREAAKYLRAFAEEARESGMVAAAIERNAVRGVSVAGKAPAQ